MEARRGGDGGRLGKLLLGTYALLVSVVQYIADFIKTFFLNSLGHIHIPGVSFNHLSFKCKIMCSKFRH